MVFLSVPFNSAIFRITSGRIKVITFDRHFTPDEQDTGLKDELKTPESLSGILNWILQGNQRYNQDPEALSPPPAVVHATEEYHRHSDKVGLFLSDFASEAGAGLYSCKDLYNAYSEWCKQNQYWPEGKQSFIGEIRKRAEFKEKGTIDGKTVRNVFSVESVD